MHEKAVFLSWGSSHMIWAILASEQQGWTVGNVVIWTFNPELFEKHRFELGGLVLTHFKKYWSNYIVITELFHT